MPIESCFIDYDAYTQFMPYAQKFAVEIAGLCLGHVRGGAIMVTHIMIPPQNYRSHVYSEFDQRTFDHLVPYLFDLRERTSDISGFGIVAWIHTHPRLGVFTSDKDKETLRTVTAMCPEVLFIVVDPFELNRNAWGGFRNDGKRIDLSVTNSLGLKAFSIYRNFEDEIPTIMKDAGLEIKFISHMKEGKDERQ
jgi:hypothetical protein